MICCLGTCSVQQFNQQFVAIASSKLSNPSCDAFRSLFKFVCTLCPIHGFLNLQTSLCPTSLVSVQTARNVFLPWSDCPFSLDAYLGDLSVWESASFCVCFRLICLLSCLFEFFHSGLFGKPCFCFKIVASVHAFFQTYWLEPTNFSSLDLLNRYSRTFC